MQLTGTKRLKDGRQMLPAGGYSQPTENQGIMNMETGEIIALSKKDQRIADAKKNRKEIMEKLQAKVDKENAEKKKVGAFAQSIKTSGKPNKYGFTKASYRINTSSGTEEKSGFVMGEYGFTLDKSKIGANTYKEVVLTHLPTGKQIVSASNHSDGRKVNDAGIFEGMRLGIEAMKRVDVRGDKKMGDYTEKENVSLREAASAIRSSFGEGINPVM